MKKFELILEKGLNQYEWTVFIEHSSRSHSIFRLRFESREKNDKEYIKTSQ